MISSIPVPEGVVANILGCNIIVSKFELLSSYEVHFLTKTLKKSMKLIILLAVG